MTTTVNWTFKRGETWRIEYTLFDRNGAPLPIVDGDTITFRLSRGSNNVFKATTIRGLSSSPYLIVPGVSGGNQCIVIIPDNVQDSSVIGLKVYDHELFYSSPDRGDSVQVDGKLTVARSLKEATP